MQAKKSLTLSEELVKTLGKLAGTKVSQSAFIESILGEFVNRRAAARRETPAMIAINRHAAQLNADENAQRAAN